MLNVLLTTDTEAWPRRPAGPDASLDPNFGRDVYGETSSGEYGIRYQVERLNAYGLKAVIFVESLVASAAGRSRLEKVVSSIQNAGHDVQLHLHTEWLGWMSKPLLPGRTGQHIKDFSFEEQTLLIRQGLQNLRDCGAAKINAFRAGNFGANRETLRALAALGVVYDTSYNACYLAGACAITDDEPIVQPRYIEGVFEVPVTVFRDIPGHYRPVHIAGCSSSELRNMLLLAWRRGWRAFVIVSHSFELLNGTRLRPDPIAVRRFERICAFLAQNPDKFRTTTFSEISPDDLDSRMMSEPLSSNVFRTGLRAMEQIARRWHQ